MNLAENFGMTAGLFLLISILCFFVAGMWMLDNGHRSDDMVHPIWRVVMLVGIISLSLSALSALCSIWVA